MFATFTATSGQNNLLHVNNEQNSTSNKSLSVRSSSTQPLFGSTARVNIMSAFQREPKKSHLHRPFMQSPAHSHSSPPSEAPSQDAPPVPARPATHEVVIPEQDRENRGRKETRHCFCGRRAFVCYTYVSVVFSFMAFIFIGIVIFRRGLTGLRVDDDDVGTCVPCSLLEAEDKIAFETKQLMALLSKRPGTNNDELCCAKTSGQMSSMMELIMSTRKDLKEDVPALQEKTMKFIPVRAHVPLYRATGDTSTKAKIKNLLFDTTAPGVHSHNILVRETGLNIIHNGTYFIYSSVAFTSELCKTWKNEERGAYIMRRNALYYDRTNCLLQTVHNCCENCTISEHTGTTGGVFSLRKDDEIYMQIPITTSVKFDADMTYIGLVMLSST